MSWEGLGENPVPGDPDAVRAAAARLARIGEQAELLHGRLRALDGGSGPQVWRGEAADKFRDMLSTIGPDLARLSSGHHDAERALRSYADALESAQRQARRAETDAEHSIADRKAAKARADQASSEASSHDATVRATTLRLAEARVAQLTAPPDPVYHQQLQQYQQQQGAQQANARSRAGEARQRESAARTDAGRAEGRLAAAKKLADQAASLRDDAARTAVTRLDDAGATGIRHQSFLERTRRAIDDRLRDITSSPEFESWMNIISDVGGIMSTLGGLLVRVPIPWVAGTGAVLLAAGIAFKGVAFAGTLLAARYGNASMGQVAGRGLDMGLTALGALRLLRAGGATGSASKIKRALWYDDARHAKGALRGVTAAPAFSAKTADGMRKLHIDPKTAFRVKTAAETGLTLTSAGKSLYEDGTRLHKDITRFHDPVRQHDLPDELPRAAKEIVNQVGGATGQDDLVTDLAGDAAEYLADQAIEMRTR